MEDTTKNFSGDLYCFLFELKVRAIVGDVLGDPSGFSFSGNILFCINKYVRNLLVVGLPSIVDLNVTKVTENTWMATWKPHAKQEQCGIEYYVTYWNGAVQTNLLSKEANVSFDAEGCSNVNVTVKIMIGETEGAEQTVSRSCID